MLHRDAKALDYDGLRALDTPSATPTHVPIPHYRVVDMLKTTLGMYGHEVVSEHHGVTGDGMRYLPAFGPCTQGRWQKVVFFVD